MKLSKTAIGLLTNQYCAVLKNAAIALAGVMIISAPAMADEVVKDRIIVETGDTKSFENSEMNDFHNTENGGAVSSAGTVSFVKSSFANNSAANGGAIYNVAAGDKDPIAGNIYLENASFTDNTAENKGGAIYNEGDLNISNTKFTDNSSAQHSGAIANEGSANLTILNSSFDNNKATTLANGQGGAILNNANIDKLDATFTGNEAAMHGGALANFKTIGDITGSFNNNKAIAQRGGAVFNYGGTINSINATFSGNEAGLSGGAITNYAGGKITSIAGSFAKNIADDAGGAIQNQSVIENITAQFTSNVAKTKNGGAISNTGTIGDFANNSGGINDSKFDSNKSVKGGAISNENGGTMVVSDTTFVENGADVSGGAIYNYDGGKLSLNDVNFINNSAVTNGGAIYNAGTLNVENVHFSNNKSDDTNSGAIYNEAGATFAFNGKATFATESDSVWNAGTMTVAKGAEIINNSTITNLGSLTFADGATYTFALEQGVIDGTVTLGGAVNLNPIIAVGSDNGNYEVVKQDGSVSGTGDWSLSANSIYDIVIAGDKLSLDITLKGADAITADIANKVGAGTSISANDSNAILAMVAGDTKGANKSFDTVINAVNANLQSSDANKVAAGLKAAKQMSADTTKSTATTTVSAANQVFVAAGTRLSGGSVNVAPQGAASGDEVKSLDSAVWVQGMTNSAELSGDNGYTADASGIAMGLEHNFSKSVMAGLGFAKTQTSVETDNRTIDTDTNTLLAYGQYKPNQWYVNAIASYSFGSNEEMAGVKSAESDVNSFAVQAMTGYEFNVAGLTLTPEAGARYLSITQDSYKDSLATEFSEVNTNILTGVAGAKIAKAFVTEKGVVLTPELRGALSYDIQNDADATVVALANGSSYSVAGSSLDELGYEVGAGLTAQLSSVFELSVSYEGKFKTDYADHTGLLNAKLKF